MRRICLLGIFVIFLSGCVSTQNMPIKEGAISPGKGQSVIGTTREKPGFSAMTAGKGAFALMGAVAAISAGNELVKENDVQDPAPYIGNSLMERLAKEYKLSKLNQAPDLVKGTSIKEIAQASAASDLVLDVQTLNWSFIYFPTDWSHYRVMYTAKLRLIDTKNQTMLAEGFCKRIPEKTMDSPTYEQLVDNGAAGLKKELKKAADFCVEEFSTKVLNLASR